MTISLLVCCTLIFCCRFTGTSNFIFFESIDDVRIRVQNLCSSISLFIYVAKLCRIRALLATSCRTIPMSSFMHSTSFIMRQKATSANVTAISFAITQKPFSVDVDHYLMRKGYLREHACRDKKDFATASNMARHFKGPRLWGTIKSTLLEQGCATANTPVRART